MIDYKNLPKIAVDPKTGVILDKKALADALDAIFIANGYEVGPPTMTIEELHESMAAHGVRAEDNIGSRDIIRQRYGCEDEE